MTLAMTPSDRSQGRRWLGLALVASLALNFVGIGTSAGLVWRKQYDHAPGTIQYSPNLLGYAALLPEARRKELWTRTEEARQHIKPFRRDLRMAREDALELLVAEPFDRERFVAAQKRLLEADAKARVAVYALYAEIAESLTPHERRGFLIWREKHRPPQQNLLDEPDTQAGGQQK